MVGPRALLATCHRVERGSGPGPGGTDNPHKVLSSILSSPLMSPHSKKPTVRQKGSRTTLHLTGEEQTSCPEPQPTLFPATPTLALTALQPSLSPHLLSGPEKALQKEAARRLEQVCKGPYMAGTAQSESLLPERGASS